VTPKKHDPKPALGGKTPRGSSSSQSATPAGACPNALWRALFECSSEAILLFDEQFTITHANKAAEKLIGKSAGRIEGKASADVFQKSELEPADALLRRAKKSHAAQQTELRLDKNGAWLLLTADPIMDPSGRFCGIVQRLSDITVRKKMEMDLREAELRYRTLFEQAADPVMLVDAETGVVVECSEIAHTILGYDREQFMQRKISELEAPLSAEEADRVKERLLAEGLSSHDTRYRASDGSLRDVRVSSRSVMLNGRRYIQSIWRDVTEQKRAEESMQALSLVDDLTGLYNRRGFQTLAEQQFKIAARMRKKMYLIFLDVDGMKRVNDTKGHREGNQLLVEAASAIRQAFRNSDIAARIGGDEFVVLVLEAERLWPAMLRGRLDSKVAAKNAGGRDPALSLSVGIVAFNPEDPAALEDLLHQADQAMYEEKRAKRDAAN